MHDATETDGDVAVEPDRERPAEALFLVLEGGDPSAGGARHLLGGLDEVVFQRYSSRAALRSHEHGRRRLTLRVPDGRMSSHHARLARTPEGWLLEDAGSRNGTRVNGGSVQQARLEDGDWIELGRTFFRFRTGIMSGLLDAPDSRSEPGTGQLGFDSLLPSLAKKLRLLSKVVTSTASPILLIGETGTGKEVLARGIHALSEKRGPFVPVNCGALPEHLVESMLFGHTKGAFTGATRDELGFIRAADGGTLFLDEIGELPLPSQAALLRVLQEKVVTPVGATTAVPADVRIVTATNAPLDDLMSRGVFRGDLFARISGFTHQLPPLRERKEDLGTIVAALLRKARPVTITAEAARMLLNHSWPHNIRELENVLTVAAALPDDGEISPEHLPERLTAQGSTRPAPRVDDEDLRRALVEELARNKGNISQAARSLGKARTQIQRWVKRFSIDLGSFK